MPGVRSVDLPAGCLLDVGACTPRSIGGPGAGWLGDHAKVCMHALSLCVYVCVCVCITGPAGLATMPRYVCDMYVCMYVCMYTYMLCVYVCVCVCVCVCIYV